MPDSWSKRSQFWSPAGAVGEFSSAEFTFWADSYPVSIPHLQQCHIKDPGHSSKSAGGWLQLNRHTPLKQQSWSGLNVLSRHSTVTSQGKELPCNWTGKTCPQWSQLAEPLWTDLSLKSGIGVCELISTQKKKKKKHRQRNNSLNLPHNPRIQAKSHHHHVFDYFTMNFITSSSVKMFQHLVWRLMCLNLFFKFQFDKEELEFKDHRVYQLWAVAQKTNWSPEELQSFKVTFLNPCWADGLRSVLKSCGFYSRTCKLYWVISF